MMMMVVVVVVVVVVGHFYTLTFLPTVSISPWIFLTKFRAVNNARLSQLLK